MAEKQISPERLTQVAIRDEYLKYAALERGLLAQMIAMEKSGGGESAPAVNDRAQKIRDRAAVHLNGYAAHVLPANTGGGPTLSEVRIDLEAVRLIMDALSRRRTEAAATEAMEKAEQLLPAFDRLRRGVVLKVAELRALAAQLDAFLEDAGEARHALPGIYIPGAHDYAHLIDMALAEGLITHAEIRKAQNARA